MVSALAAKLHASLISSIHRDWPTAFSDAIHLILSQLTARGPHSPASGIFHSPLLLYVSSPSRSNRYTHILQICLLHWLTLVPSLNAFLSWNRILPSQSSGSSLKSSSSMKLSLSLQLEAFFAANS